MKKKRSGLNVVIPSLVGWGGRGNSVAITAARIRAGWSGFQIPEVTKVFLFSKQSEPALESTQPLNHWILWFLPRDEVAGA